MNEYDLIGDIGYDITPQLVQAMLAKANGEDVTFFMASLGGSLDDGITINQLISKYPGKTYGVLIGNTASAGTIAILGCDTVEAKNTAPFLIHNAIDGRGGNAIELRKQAAMLDKHDKIMIGIYKKKTGLDEQAIIDLMAKEDWLLPEEAQKLGFIDSISESSKLVAYYPNNKLSAELLNKLNAKMSLFKSKKHTFVHAFKDGTQILADAEDLAADVEIAPVGAATLEDGTYELVDGSMITIKDGSVTEVKEPEPMAGMDVEAVADAAATAAVEALTPVIDEMRAEFNEKIQALVKTPSGGKVPKEPKVPSGALKPEKSVTARVREKVKANFEERKKAREGK